VTSARSSARPQATRGAVAAGAGLASMTGFARAEGHADGVAWMWELKSVNGRGLDVRCRLAQGAEHLDGAVRQSCAARFKRGNLSVQLTLARADGLAPLRLNRDLIDQIIRLHGELTGKIEPALPRLEGLLAVRGVLEASEPLEDEAQRARRDEALMESLSSALDRMDEARRAEGGRLAQVLMSQVDEIEGLAREAAASAALQPDQVKARFEVQLRELMGSVPMPSEERLAQEIVLLVAKCDVREELDRLTAHIASARDMLREGGAIGRRLDFLCQELNREANTICSKAAELALTRVGLALKSTIEQLREQVQNVE